jgi:hypothetical protein
MLAKEPAEFLGDSKSMMAGNKFITAWRHTLSHHDGIDYAVCEDVGSQLVEVRLRHIPCPASDNLYIGAPHFKAGGRAPSLRKKFFRRWLRGESIF